MHPTDACRCHMLPSQEEERERRMDFIPEESAIQVDAIEVDKDTMDMLKDIGCGSLPGLSVVQTRAQVCPAALLRF